MSNSIKERSLTKGVEGHSINDQEAKEFEATGYCRVEFYAVDEPINVPENFQPLSDDDLDALINEFPAPQEWYDE